MLCILAHTLGTPIALGVQRIPTCTFDFEPSLETAIVLEVQPIQTCVFAFVPISEKHLQCTAMSVWLVRLHGM